MAQISKTVIISGHEVHVKVTDTAGQERFNTITRRYYMGKQGFLIVYDVTRIGSFAHIEVRCMRH